MTAQTLRDNFHGECTKAIALVDQVENARTQQGRALPPLQRNLVFETAFLRVLLGWESFLEDIFLHYLCGRPGTNGYAHVLPLVTPRSIDKARATILGDRDYLTWTSSRRVKRRADHWLGSSPQFAAGYNRAPEVADMYRIRNRIAHSSTKAISEFEAARLRLAPGRTHYRGFGPGMVLRYVRSGNQRTLDRFVAQLSNAATEVAAGP